VCAVQMMNCKLDGLKITSPHLFFYYDVHSNQC
jgi:hypothetical protein